MPYARLQAVIPHPGYKSKLNRETYERNFYSNGRPGDDVPFGGSAGVTGESSPYGTRAADALGSRMHSPSPSGGHINHLARPDVPVPFGLHAGMTSGFAPDATAAGLTLAALASGSMLPSTADDAAAYDDAPDGDGAFGSEHSAGSKGPRYDRGSPVKRHKTEYTGSV